MRYCTDALKNDSMTGCDGGTAARRSYPTARRHVHIHALQTFQPSELPPSDHLTIPALILIYLILWTLAN